MSSQTSLVAEQVRLRQWAAQIQEGQNSTTPEDWCLKFITILQQISSGKIGAGFCG